MENDLSKTRCEKIYELSINCLRELRTDPNQILKASQCNILIEKYKSICEKKE